MYRDGDYVFSPVSKLDPFYFCLHQDPQGLTNADNAFTLYYVKFRVAAPKVNVSIIFCSSY